MMHDPEKKSASYNHDAMIGLRKKMAEDVRKRTLRRTHCYYHNTRHFMRPVLSSSTSEDRSSARQSPQELAEKAAVTLALNITSGKKPN